MNLQPLYDVKERLEYAAIAGVSLLGEDFRLQRGLESLKPLAAASPVFGKIDAGLAKLLSVPADQRPGLLLDVLALVDAVAYTQAKTGMEGELEPLPVGSGQYRQISYGQIQPLLAALTTTGGGRVEVVNSAWERCADDFLDYRVLPALVGGLGDSYGEMADLCAQLLKKLGPSVVPVLKKGFDPAGKREMARRVEVLAAVEGAEAAPWLREILPGAKKDVRAAVIRALGADSGDVSLLLELVKAERGDSRDAALEALARQDGAEVRAFWEKELTAHSQSVKFLEPSNADWAVELVTAGLRQRLEKFLDGEKRPAYEDGTDLTTWCWSLGHKDAPATLDFWRWADSRMEDIDQLKDEKDRPLFLGVKLTDRLRDIMLHTGPGLLRDFCLGLFDSHPAMTRYLPISVQAALLSLPGAAVYEKYSPYLLTEEPTEDAEHKETLNTVLLRALSEVYWNRKQGCHVIVMGQAIAQSLDARWIERLVHAACKPNMGHYYPFGGGDEVDGFDKNLAELANPNDPEQCAQLVPYLRRRMVETGSWYSYSQYLLRLGGSPKGVLGEAMKKGKPAAIYYVWFVLNEAYKVLPAAEVAELCREGLDAKQIRSQGREAAMAELALPWTIEQLKAGKPFPEWDEWNKMRP
ncbi:MAG: HEAT repeat domain-containing protein [Oscillospiraceae bacterium]|nr:HEAT repeat domain-containing protein [Oscillospiraceae bacterium]